MSHSVPDVLRREAPRLFALGLIAAAYALARPPGLTSGQREALASFDQSGFAPEMQIILTAMKKYGIVLADCGSNWYVTGVPDEHWDNDTLVGEFNQLHGSDFEAVDTSGMQVSADSAQAQIP